MEFELETLVWDGFNSEHIKKHGLTKAEVEKACVNHVSVYESRVGRLILIGNTGNRFLSVVLANKGNKRYYPVTARVASRKERKLLNEKIK